MALAAVAARLVDARRRAAGADDPAGRLSGEGRAREQRGFGPGKRETADR
jgi:hypothetical protein